MKKRIQAENDNARLEAILKDRDCNVNNLTCINTALKEDKDTLSTTKAKLMNDLERYKSHIIVLTDQTEKLTNELQRIIDEDAAVYNLNNAQIQRLKQVIFENKKLLSDEIAALNALENYVRSQSISPGCQTVIKTTTTYSC